MLLIARYIANGGLLSFFFLQSLIAQPLNSTAIVFAGQTVFRDLKRSNLYYYIPFDYRLATDGAGKPDFALIEMRYTGSVASGDQGVSKYNNILQFRVTLDLSAQKNLGDLQTALRKAYPSAELRILPVRKFSSVLVFAGTGATEATDSVRLFKASYAEATDVNAEANNAYWNERVIGFRLNNLDAQMVEGALRKGQAVLSFSYAIYGGFADAPPEISIKGSGLLQKQVSDYFKSLQANSGDTTLKITMVKANAFGIDVNPDTWPSVIQKVDINEKVPARYPLLDVYCYDFNNELRADLYQKKIEVKATGITGADIISSFSFKASLPDLYSKNIRFPYAVRFDKPFYYRVTEIGNDGEVVTGEWVLRKEWTEILDITTPIDKQVRKQSSIDQ
jgi:hypothetical protein